MVGNVFACNEANAGGSIALAPAVVSVPAPPRSAGGRRVIMDEETLIQEYERLRHSAHELDVQAEAVDRRLVEIEGQLPDWYTFPGDPPLDDLRYLPRRP